MHRPEEPSATLAGWLDLSSGVSGDMLLGALVDAGVPLAVPQSAIDALGLPIRLRSRRVRRGAIAATKVDVVDMDMDEIGVGTATGTGRPPVPLTAPRRTWSDIRDRLVAAPLAEPVRERALNAFTRLAEAEGLVHDILVDDVHFHEVGGLDAIADIVGVSAGLDSLGLSTLLVSTIALGGGSARTEHGRLPVPGPAVLELLRASGLPASGGPLDVELCTPTGAALVAGAADGSGPLPAMRVTAIGNGAGERDIPGYANIVRLVLGVPTTVGGPAAATKGPVTHGPATSGPAPTPHQSTSRPTGVSPPATELLIETNVDDVDPRIWPEVLAALLAAGAADAWLTPIQMKKGRPAHTLSVLVDPSAAEAVREVVFRHTPTLGLRESPIRKYALARAFRAVDVGGESVRVKIGFSSSGEPYTAQPEWDDVLRAARLLGLPAREVLARASALAREACEISGRRRPPGRPDQT